MRRQGALRSSCRTNRVLPDGVIFWRYTISSLLDLSGNSLAPFTLFLSPLFSFSFAIHQFQPKPCHGEISPGIMRAAHD